MEMEIKYGQMEVSIKENGNKIKQMELVFCIIQIMMYMKENGQMIRKMDLEPSICTKKDKLIKEISEME